MDTEATTYIGIYTILFILLLLLLLACIRMGDDTGGAQTSLNNDGDRIMQRKKL